MFGKRLRSRARELGLSDAEVARRAGLTERRYAFYVSGDRQPDLATLVRISNVLACTPNDLLLETPPAAAEPRTELMGRLQSVASAIADDDLRIVVIQAEAVFHMRTRESAR